MKGRNRWNESEQKTNENHRRHNCWKGLRGRMGLQEGHRGWGQKTHVWVPVLSLRDYATLGKPLNPCELQFPSFPGFPRVHEPTKSYSLMSIPPLSRNTPGKIPHRPPYTLCLNTDRARELSQQPWPHFTAVMTIKLCLNLSPTCLPLLSTL